MTSPPLPQGQSAFARSSLDAHAAAGSHAHVDEKGWWKKMESAAHNEADKEKPSVGGSFVPQLMPGSGLTTRLVPRGGSAPMPGSSEQH